MRHDIVAAFIPFAIVTPLFGPATPDFHDREPRALFPGSLAPRLPGSQVEVDRILSRVHGTIITTSDVRQARLLKLLPPNVDSDEKALRELENRRLILAEVARLPPAAPSSEALAAHRREWEAALGSGRDAADLRARFGLTDSAASDWLRDDLLIAAYLKDRFGMLPDADRTARIEQWIAGLRQRAGLR